MNIKENIETVKIDEIKSPEWNPRTITRGEIAKLENSITEFGYIEPIIVNKHNMNIIGGNQRFKALKELGHETVEVLFINEPDPAKEKAINLALNKIGGEFDIEMLEDVFEDINMGDLDIDLELTGFSEYEISEMLNFGDDILDDDEDIEDDYPEDEDKPLHDYDKPKDQSYCHADPIEQKTRTFYLKPGDVWIIGNHKLIAGKPTENDKFRILIDNDDFIITFNSVAGSDNKEYDKFIKENEEVIRLSVQE
jgi:hypothetical protein